MSSVEAIFKSGKHRIPHGPTVVIVISYMFQFSSVWRPECGIEIDCSVWGCGALWKYSDTLEKHMIYDPHTSFATCSDKVNCQVKHKRQVDSEMGNWFSLTRIAVLLYLYGQAPLKLFFVADENEYIACDFILELSNFLNFNLSTCFISNDSITNTTTASTCVFLVMSVTSNLFF